MLKNGNSQIRFLFLNNRPLNAARKAQDLVPLVMSQTFQFLCLGNKSEE
jgi:hypothetical protein